MAERNKIVKFCEEYLEIKKFSDETHNGLQVEGSDKISRIICGVSLSEKLIKKAIEKNAQMIIVHHGIFNSQITNPPSFRGILKNRLKLLLENNINLLGFHLPLDAHPEIGNNISICKLLGVKKAKKFDVGFIGILDQKINREKFIETVNKKLKVKSYVISAGPKYIRKVGVISGAASPEYRNAYELGCDTYLTGDIRESTVRGVEEIGINFINAGHYNTEKLGVQNLGNLLARKFKIKVEFIDVPCDI